MVLSDRDIRKHLKSGKIVVSPRPKLSEALGSCSIDLSLGSSFRVFEYSRYPFIDPFDKTIGDKITREVHVSKGDPFIIHPGDFVLGTTIEHIEIPDNLTGRLEGRSSIGRLGIVIHSTAGNIECGFRGSITLELANMGKLPVALYPGIRICSVSFEQLSTPADVPYHKKKNAKYSGQRGPGQSRIHEEK